MHFFFAANEYTTNTEHTHSERTTFQFLMLQFAVFVLSSQLYLFSRFFLISLSLSLFEFHNDVPWISKNRASHAHSNAFFLFYLHFLRFVVNVSCEAWISVVVILFCSGKYLSSLFCFGAKIVKK